METLLKQEVVNFEILDTKESLLQVILLPNQAIYVELNDIVYCSSGLVLRDASLPWYKRLFKQNIGLRTQIKNRKGGIEYLGISKTPEKIIALSPSVFEEHFVLDKNYVLAYTRGIKIHTFPEPYVLLKHHQWREVRGNGIVFLQGSSGLIEKKLGPDEEFNISKNHIAGFSKTVKIYESNIYQSIFEVLQHDWCLVKVKGPGTVFCVSNWKRENKPWTSRIKIDTLIVLLFVLMYMIGLL